MTIRFLKAAGGSCLGGKWQRISVESAHTQDEKFFPIKDELSYEIQGNRLVIGRNQICDAYLHLIADSLEIPIHGDFTSFGWESRKLGFFTLNRQP